MSEPLSNPSLKKPPGYKDPNAPVTKPPFRPPRKAVLPPSFRPQKRRRSCCRLCCCCLCLFFLLLFFIIIISGVIFYIWFDPKLPGFHVQSFRLSRFNVTKKSDGTYLDAKTTTRIEVKNPNAKMTYYYGVMEVDVAVGEGGDETELGTARVGEFTMRKQNTTSLRVETKVSNQLVDGGVGTRLKARFRRKALAVNVEARTRIGVGVGGLKIGMVGVTVKCDGITMKRLDAGDMPKCVINMFKWLNIH